MNEIGFTFVTVLADNDKTKQQNITIFSFDGCLIKQML